MIPSWQCVFNGRLLFTCLTPIIWMKRKTNKREIVRKWTVNMNKHSDLLCVLFGLDGERNTFCMNDGFTVTSMSAVEHVFFCCDREAGSVLWSSLIFDVCSLTVAFNRCNHFGHLFFTVYVCSHNFLFLLFSKCFKRE